MYPDLSYLFHDLLGTSFDNWTSIFKSFGLMLGLAFLACGYLVYTELSRLEREGLVKPIQVKNTALSSGSWADYLFNAIISAVLIAKIPYIISHFDQMKADPASIIFSTKGNWWLGGLALLSIMGYMFYKQKENKKTDIPEMMTLYPHEKTVDIIVVAALFGVLGSRLFSIFENLDDFFRDPMGQLLSGSGLTVYGGLILAFIAVYIYIKKLGIKPIYMMDIAGMGILLGYAIGRIGCQVAGDSDWGIVAAAQPSWWFLPDWLWSYNYPDNVSNDGVLLSGCNAQAFEMAKGTVEERCLTACGMRYCHELSPKVYPTPVYETIVCLLGFLLLYLNRKKIKIAGLLFFFYMIFNGIERFFIESIRINEKYELFGMHWSQAQFISIGFIIVGIIGAVILMQKKPGWELELTPKP